MQTRTQTLIEVLTNTFTGLIGSWLITYFCVLWIPNVALAVTMSSVGCTIWSLIRGYFIRRSFARWHR